jgi:hypothetical protein
LNTEKKVLGSVVFSCEVATIVGGRQGIWVPFFHWGVFLEMQRRSVFLDGEIDFGIVR